MTTIPIPPPPSNKRRILFGRLAALALIQTLITAWLFRANWSDGFSFVLGDRYDNLIEIAILEHWYNVVRGLADWATTNYFFPYPKTLGYNDGYLLYGLIYSLPRILGVDPLLSSMLVNMAMKAAAFFFFFLFSRTVLRTGFWCAAAGATLFEISNNIVLHFLHAQLLTVALAPLCAMLLYFSGAALLGNDRPRLLRFGSLFAATYGIWAMTSYYMLWFFSFFSGLALLALAVANWRSLRKRIALIDRRTWGAAAFALLLLALALLPFLLVYLPKARETGMHGFGAALSYSLAPFDILNIGTDNYMYGSLVRALHERIDFPTQFSEHQMGMPPGLLLTFLLGAALAWRRRREPAGQLILALALAALAMWALALVVDGHTAWRYVFHFVPGAKAVRVVSRSMIFLVFPVVCVAMYLLASPRSARGGALAALCCALLIAEQANRRVPTHMERAPVVNRLAALAPAPAGCRAFFVRDARPNIGADNPAEHQYYKHNVAAMLIAEYVDLPTINGFSSFNPPDWNFDHADRADYPARVAAYADKHGIRQGLCSLDLETGRWSPR